MIANLPFLFASVLWPPDIRAPRLEKVRFRARFVFGIQDRVREDIRGEANLHEPQDFEIRPDSYDSRSDPAVDKKSIYWLPLSWGSRRDRFGGNVG